MDVKLELFVNLYTEYQIPINIKLKSKNQNLNNYFKIVLNIIKVLTRIHQIVKHKNLINNTKQRKYLKLKMEEIRLLYR